MIKKYEPPYITILTSISLINIIFSTYFITVLLAGVVFKIFLEVLKKGYYYILLFTIFTFMVIENIQGLNFFSLSIVTVILYYLVIPKIKHIFSSSIMAEFIFILLFYIGFLLFNSVIVDSDIFLTILLNFLLDSIIVGFVL
jgi:hypothetical protein